MRIRPYFNGDIYHLTKISPNDDVWSACQFDRPENGDGLVQVFRREHAPYDTADFFLRGIDQSANYVFTDLDDESTVTVSGEDLLTSGLRICIPKQRTAKIWIYSKG